MKKNITQGLQTWRVGTQQGFYEGDGGGGSVNLAIFLIPLFWIFTTLPDSPKQWQLARSSQEKKGCILFSFAPQAKFLYVPHLFLS